MLRWRYKTCPCRCLERSGVMGFVPCLAGQYPRKVILMRKWFAIGLVATGMAVFGAPLAVAMPAVKTSVIDAVSTNEPNVVQVRHGGRGAFRYRGNRGFGLYGGRRSGYHRRWRSRGFYGYPYSYAYPRSYRRSGIFFRF